MNEIVNNGAFCIMPWISLHAWPNGNAYLCCISNTEIPEGSGAVGNLSNNTIAEIVNSDVMKNVRLDMLAGRKNPRCARCYEAERLTNYSWRQGFTKTFADTIGSNIAETSPDGTITPKLLYVDLRFSNICNLECRTCGHDLSSAIANREHRSVTHGQHIITSFAKTKYNDDFFDLELKQYLYDTRIFYFAGGEPLLQKEVYEILQFLVDNEFFDKELKYSTNLSTLKYKQFDMVEAWKKFKSVSILCSIDHYGEKLEYIRQGSSHDVIFNNFDIITKNEFTISLETVVSIYNIYYLSDFLEYLDKMGYIENIDIIDLLYVYGDTDHPGLLPTAAKQELIEKLNNDKSSELYVRLFNKFPWFKQMYDGLEEFVNTDIISLTFDDFLDKVNTYDVIYDTNLFNTFPWLGKVITSYKVNGNG